MSKKPRQSRHRIPNIALEPRSAQITPEYQRQIDRSMIHGAAAENRALKRLQAAQRRLEKAIRQAKTKEVQKLEILVDLRRQELEALHRAMTYTGAPSTARGKASYRNIPPPATPL